MGMRRALKGIYGEVQEHLNDVGAVYWHADVFGQRVNFEPIVVFARMDAHQMGEVSQKLVYADAWRFIGLPPQKAQVAARYFNAVCDLARNRPEPVLDEFQIIDLKPLGIANSLVHELNESGNDCQRPVDVMDDAGVNLATGVGHLLFDFLVLQFAEQFLQLFGVGMNFTFQRSPLHGAGDGSAHGRKVKRFVNVIASAQTQRLAHRIGRFESGHHHDFDARINELQSLQNLDSGHARHADVKHRDIDAVILGQFDCGGAVGSGQNVVIVLEDELQGHSRPLFVVNNEKSASTSWCFRRYGGIGMEGRSRGRRHDQRSIGTIIESSNEPEKSSMGRILLDSTYQTRRKNDEM